MDMNQLGELAPAAPKMLAAGVVNARTVYGSRKASGSISFAGQPSAGHTVTVNGVVFTARASDATGNEFNIGGDLAATMTNLATALNASVVSAVAAATYTAQAAAVSVSYDLAGAAGNEFTLAASDATVSGAKLTGGHDADELDVSIASVFLMKTVTGSNMAFVLPDGIVPGQETTLFLETRGGTANAVVSGTFAGGTAATFDAVGEFLFLKWLGGAWRVLTNGGSVALA